MDSTFVGVTQVAVKRTEGTFFKLLMVAPESVDVPLTKPATVIGLAVRGIIPWWLVAVLAVRELVMGVVLLLLRRGGWEPLQVSFAGKTATLCLLYAFPLLLLGSHPASYAEVVRIVGWSFVIWGSALYWWAAGLYIAQARQLLAEEQAGPVSPRAP